MNGYRLIDIADPINDTDAVSKKYVDGPMREVTTNIAGHEERIHTLETNPPSASDASARTAIGWPYENVQSLDTRMAGVFNDTAIVKGRIGLDYTSTFSIDHRLKSIEGATTDRITGVETAIGMPYPESQSIRARLDNNAS